MREVYRWMDICDDVTEIRITHLL